MTTSRFLSKSEINILSEIYGKNVDLSKIKITRKHLFSILLKRFTAVTFGNKIAYNNKKYSEDFSEKDFAMSILVHEVCHVWQHQQLDYHWTKAMMEQIRFGKKVYKYNIYDFETLTEFRFEQQGEIMADYYRQKISNGEEFSRYHDVVYSVLKN